MPADAVTLTLNTLDECHRDATLCGPHVVDALASIIAELRNALSASLDRQDAQDVARLGRKSAMLVALAKEAIATYPYSEVPAHWRRLYMDASLLQVVADLRLVSLHSHAANVLPRLLDLVRTLDMANIVTGYFEDGRRQALDCLMAYTQEMLVECGKEQTQDGPEEPPVKRVRMTEVQECTDPSKARLLSNVRQIKRYASLDEAPEMFELSGCSEPFVVTDGVSHWPAIADPKTAWKDAAYLRAVAGRGRIVPVEIGSSYVAEGWTQKMLDFDTFLRDIRWQRDGKQDKTVSDGNPVVYLAQHDLFQQFPSLLSDIIPPDYVFAEPGPPEHFPDYCPPSTLSGYTLNAWMGPKGTYSPAHTDPYYNCYAQVVGTKHVWVAPPSCTAFMTAATQPSEEDGSEAVAGDESVEQLTGNAASEHFMGNTARIDVFSEDALVSSAYTHDVLPHAQQAILREGDLLFMPPKWWHAIKSLERSFSVSMWF